MHKEIIKTILDDLGERLTLEFIQYEEDTHNYKFVVGSKVTLDTLRLHNERCEWFCREISKFRQYVEKANLHEGAIWNEYKEKALKQMENK